MLLGSFSSGRLKKIESYEITHMMDNFFLVSGPATSLHIMATLISHSIDLHAHFPSIGSDDPPPPPPLGVKNVKIQENSEKIRGPPGGP